MPITRQDVHEFATDMRRIQALRSPGCAVIARLPDGSEVELPGGTAAHLVEAYTLADRTGAAVAVAGDGETVSAREAAKLLGVSRPTIYKWLEQGKLSEHRDTNDHRVYVDSIERVLRRRQAHHEQVLADLEENPDADHNVRLRERARAIRARQQA